MTDAPARRPRLCPECSLPIERKSSRGPVPVFCCSAHKVAFNNRQTVRGRTIVSLAMAWRQQRGKKGVGSSAFEEMNRILDSFNAEDREAGRPPVTEYAANALLADGRSYTERRDWRKERDQQREGLSEAVREAQNIAANPQ